MDRDTFTHNRDNLIHFYFSRYEPMDCEDYSVQEVVDFISTERIPEFFKYVPIRVAERGVTASGKVCKRKFVATYGQIWKNLQSRSDSCKRRNAKQCLKRTDRGFEAIRLCNVSSGHLPGYKYKEFCDLRKIFYDDPFANTEFVEVDDPTSRKRYRPEVEKSSPESKRPRVEEKEEAEWIPKIPERRDPEVESDEDGNPTLVRKNQVVIDLTEEEDEEEEFNLTA